MRQADTGAWYNPHDFVAIFLTQSFDEDGASWVVNAQIRGHADDVAYVLGEYDTENEAQECADRWAKCASGWAIVQGKN